MSKSLVIGLSTVVVLAAFLGGGGDGARALQFGAAPANQGQTGPAQINPAPGSTASGSGAAVEKVGAAGRTAERDAPACGLRKVWVATDLGPRLKWRRPCEAD